MPQQFQSYQIGHSLSFFLVRQVLEWSETYIDTILHMFWQKKKKNQIKEIKDKRSKGIHFAVHIPWNGKPKVIVDSL